MQSITKYRAKDGAEFKTEAECLRYEGLLFQLEVLQVSFLKPHPANARERNFSNGGGFVQQEPEKVAKYKAAVWELAGQWSDLDLFKEPAEKVHPWGGAGRLIDECCPEPLYRAWGRLMNMDDQCREWGQGYYALNPDKGEQIELTA